MPLSMYQASTPVFSRMLQNMSAFLAKAAAHAEARAIDPAVLLAARLSPDMLPLTRQVQIASDAAKLCAARLAGTPAPSFPDTETTFEALELRIGNTVTFLESVPAERIDGSEARQINVKLRDREVNFTGQVYLLGFAMPNFYFHVTTTYAILRHNGVDIGKADFMGAP